MSAVAARRDVALGVDHHQPESFGIDPRELGNIGRDLAAVRPLRHLFGDFSDNLIEFRHRAAAPSQPPNHTRAEKITRSHAGTFDLAPHAARVMVRCQEAGTRAAQRYEGANWRR